MVIIGKYFFIVFRLRVKLIVIYRGCILFYIIVYVFFWLCKIKICFIFLNLFYFLVCRFFLVFRDYDLEIWYVKFLKSGK